MNKLKGSLGDIDGRIEKRKGAENAISNYKQVVEAATKSMQEMTGNMNKVSETAGGAVSTAQKEDADE